MHNNDEALASLFTVFGNGHPGAGKELLWNLAIRLDAARRKHPVFALGKYHALGVIGAEYRELEQAVEKEGPARSHDEALDVAATVIRFLNREHDVKPE